MMRLFRLALAMLGTGLLAACAVGPNFHRPAPPAVATYRAGSDAPSADAPVHDGKAAIAFDWWRIFGSPALDALEARAITHNPQVEGAQQRLRAAQAELRAGYGVFFPAAGVSFDAERQKFNLASIGEKTSGNVFWLFNPQVTISYALDIWGANRRTVEQLRAGAEQQQQVTRGTYLTLAANVASAAIARAAYREQAEILAHIVADEEELLALGATRVRAGTAGEASRLALQSQLEAARVQLAAMRQKAAQADDLLAILTGDTPGDARLPPNAFADFHAPASLPLSLPSTLTRQRPDIAAAEANAHAASAAIGIATAAMLPNVTLNAATGWIANGVSQIFSSGSSIWSYGASLAQPLFKGGTLINRRKAAVALYRATMADYRETVLAAFQQVADTLSAIDEDSTAAAAQARADAAASTALDLMRANRAAGVAGDSDLLAGDIAAEQAHANALAAEAVRLQDCVALYAALGGGWWKGKTAPKS